MAGKGKARAEQGKEERDIEHTKQPLTHFVMPVQRT